MKKEFLLLCGCFLMALGGTVLTGCGEEEIVQKEPEKEEQEQEKEEEEEPEPTPEVPQKPEKGCITLSTDTQKYLTENNTLQINFSYSAQQKIFSFTADTTWSLRIESSSEWISVASDSTTNENQVSIKRNGPFIEVDGEGSDKPYNLYIRATQNDNTETRRAYIYIHTLYHYFENPEEEKPYRYSGDILQSAPQLTEHEAYISYAGGFHEIKYISSYHKQRSLVDWIHIIGQLDILSTQPYYKVDPNNTGAKREGKIVCTGTDFSGNVLGTDTLTVIQDFQKVEMQVNVSTAGTLQDLIPFEQKYEITDLTLTGNLNGDDIRFIREMAGIDYAQEPTDGKLAYLDMSGANIVYGGKPYYDSYTTSDNKIGHYMFSDCKLCSVILPRSITNIWGNVFEKCYNLTSVSIPNHITSTGYFTFQDCISLTTIELPSEITEIEQWLFYNCENLSSLNIPNKVRVIRQRAFFNCSKLTELTLPASLETIEEGAFNNCTNLNTIHCQAAEPPLCSGALGIEEHATLYVPKGTLAKYKDAAGWKNFKEIVEE